MLITLLAALGGSFETIKSLNWASIENVRVNDTNATVNWCKSLPPRPRNTTLDHARMHMPHSATQTCQPLGGVHSTASQRSGSSLCSIGSGCHGDAIASIMSRCSLRLRYSAPPIVFLLFAHHAPYATTTTTLPPPTGDQFYVRENCEEMVVDVYLGTQRTALHGTVYGNESTFDVPKKTDAYTANCQVRVTKLSLSTVAASCVTDGDQEHRVTESCASEAHVTGWQASMLDIFHIGRQKASLCRFSSQRFFRHLRSVAHAESKSMMRGGRWSDKRFQTVTLTASAHPNHHVFCRCPTAERCATRVASRLALSWCFLSLPFWAASAVHSRTFTKSSSKPSR
jgi:hypothetical protein